MKNFIYIALTVVTITFFLSINFVLAQPTGNPPAGEPTGNPPPVKLDNPLADAQGRDVTPQQLIGKIINAAIGIVGSLALAMFIYGGFTWMLAGGNAEAVKKGKDILIWTALGLIIVFASYALVKFVFTAIGVPGIT